MLQSLFSPLNIVLLFALVVSIIFWLNTFFILYHFMRFGIGTRPKQAALIFLIGSLSFFFLFILGVIFLCLDVPSITTMLSLHNA